MDNAETHIYLEDAKASVSSTSEFDSLIRKDYTGCPPSIIEKYRAFGKYITEELRELSSEMCTFALKLINEVIFEAKLETLRKDTKIVHNNGVMPQYSVSVIAPVSSNSLNNSALIVDNHIS